MHSERPYKKVFMQYEDTNGNTVRLIKSITYETSTVVNMSFKKVDVFNSAIQYLPSLTETNFLMGDSYLITRDEDGLAQNPGITPKESAFQIVGSTIIHLRDRNLEVAQRSGLRLFRIVSEIENELATIQGYLNTATTPDQIDVEQYEYGSLSTNVRVIPPTPAAYFEFTKPTFTAESASGSEFAWVYLNDQTSTTTITSHLVTPSATNHISTYTETLSGKWSTILGHNSNCIFLREGTSYQVLRNTGMSNPTTATVVSMTSEIGALSTAKSSFVLSDDCNRIAVDKHVFVYNNNTSTYTAATNNFTALSYTSYDSSLTYLFAAGSNSIYKFNSATSTYD